MENNNAIIAVDKGRARWRRLCAWWWWRKWTSPSWWTPQDTTDSWNGSMEAVKNPKGFYCVNIWPPETPRPPCSVSPAHVEVILHGGFFGLTWPSPAEDRCFFFSCWNHPVYSSGSREQLSTRTVFSIASVSQSVNTHLNLLWSRLLFLTAVRLQTRATEPLKQSLFLLSYLRVVVLLLHRFQTGRFNVSRNSPRSHDVTQCKLHNCHVSQCFCLSSSTLAFYQQSFHPDCYTNRLENWGQTTN